MYRVIVQLHTVKGQEDLMYYTANIWHYASNLQDPDYALVQLTTFPCHNQSTIYQQIRRSVNNFCGG
jgi:hypothetical protein